ncbi:UDP-galactopyranose mutase [Lachnospiraceae bacterium ZAX-1]
MKTDMVVVGAGICGCVIARHFAEQGLNIKIIERRNHIAGNLYDFVDENGILVQKYGVHLFHTSNTKLVDYLQRFTQLMPYSTHGCVMIDETPSPTPFNFKTLDIFFDESRARQLKQLLCKNYPNRVSVTIVELLASTDPDILDLARWFVEKDYRPYTSKQWGVPMEQVDINVLKRVPVRLSYDQGSFEDIVQVLPRLGYTKLIENILNHPRISVELNCDATKIVNIEDGKVCLNGEYSSIPIVYTGSLDALFSYKYGRLPYRTLRFEWRKEEKRQIAPVVCYPQVEGYTRITDYTQLPFQGDGTYSVLCYEYPIQFDGTTEPLYPINNEDNDRIYQMYYEEAKNISNLYVCGRLADYKYYNMDQILERSLDMCDQIQSFVQED